MAEKREKLPDVLRGFAVILVVLGHCIQEGSGESFRAESLYFGDRLYQFIYSFHMPLFMMISGYLCRGSMQRAGTKAARRALLRRRTAALLLPVFLWTAVDYVRILITNHLTGAPQPEAVLFVYFYRALNNLWFLWAVFWCFLIAYFMYYFFRNSVILYMIGFAVLFFIPDGMGLGAYKYMMPFFFSAFYGHGYIERCRGRLWAPVRLWQILLAGLAFAGLFLFFDENALIYLTGYKLIGKNVPYQLWIDFYRTLIGFAGSFFFILLWEYIVEKTQRAFGVLCRLGADSMGIYIVSGYLLVFVVQRAAPAVEPSYGINILEAAAVLAASAALTELLARIPALRCFVGKSVKAKTS